MPISLELLTGNVTPVKMLFSDDYELLAAIRAVMLDLPATEVVVGRLNPTAGPDGRYAFAFIMIKDLIGKPAP